MCCKENQIGEVCILQKLAAVISDMSLAVLSGARYN